MMMKKFHEVRRLAESDGLRNRLDGPQGVRNESLRLEDDALLDYHLGRNTANRKARATQRLG